MSTNAEGEVIAQSRKGKKCKNDEDENINQLVREYSASTDLVSLNWKKNEDSTGSCFFQACLAV